MQKRIMNSMAVCASHSPLMFSELKENNPGSQRAFFSEIEATARDVRTFDPELVVVFAPDHFNAMYYDLMPSFCVVGEGYASTDWHQPPGNIRIPCVLAMDLTRALMSEGYDPAISLKMRVDHGVTIALRQICGGYETYPVLPIYVNCAADPRPSCRRTREFGGAVGRYLEKLGKRVLVIGSGGLSHDPPSARLSSCTPEQRERITVRRYVSDEEFERREARVIKMAEELARGGGPLLPPDEPWDRKFLDSLFRQDMEAFDAYGDEEIDRVGGLGGHEIRLWIAAFAAMQELGRFDTTLRYYQIVPEWITGMGIVTARTATGSPIPL